MLYFLKGTRSTAMSFDNKLDDLKQKASELGNTLKGKAEEAKVKGEQALQHIESMVHDAKIKGEEKYTQIKQEISEKIKKKDDDA